ncbi:HipA-like protein [Desulfoprunum benzoelyticum]|uniref:HipA-like protein n=2 Tax=Desulfoprunum benzoelyticum TaxID=1506996 RepID=A0A840UPH1_9BACT|nr:HipA-like protein [Desulfoprunum benzoelyticum]
MQLEGLLKQRKIDRDDKFSQLVAVGTDTVGAVTVAEII